MLLLNEFGRKTSDWICPKCKFRVYQMYNSCWKCDNRVKKGNKGDGDWICPKCNFRCFATKEYCKKCNVDRYGRPPK